MNADTRNTLRRLAANMADADRIEAARILDPRPRRRSVSEDVNDWCDRHGTSVFTLRGRGRSRDVCVQRGKLCAAMYRLGHSSVDIGLALDRDHTTVLDAIDAHERRKGRAA